MAAPQGRQVTEAIIRQIRKLLREGKSQREVAHILGVAVSTVNKYAFRPIPEKSENSSRHP